MSSHEQSSDDSHIYAPCASLTTDVGVVQLVRACNGDCGGRFFAVCCLHRRTICHHLRVVFTDGACTNNGRDGAVSGIGIAFGTDIGLPEDEDTDGHQFAIPIDDRLDLGGKRTSQRAELLAALHGRKKLCDYEARNFKDASKRRRKKNPPSDKIEVIVTTDSEYVVKGMTEWLPSWKGNNLRKSNGQRPSNLDLFLSLDTEVYERECTHDIKIRFWHIGREHNTIADDLAKRGARLAICPQSPRVEYCVSAFEVL